MSDDGQDIQAKFDLAFQKLVEQCEALPSRGAVLFSVCINLIEQLATEQPQVRRDAWAQRLYQLADTLAVGSKGQ